MSVAGLSSIIGALPSNLEELYVSLEPRQGPDNTHDDSAPIHPIVLTNIARLRRLSLQNPDEVALQVLPGWIQRLSGSLVELHLKVSTSVNFQHEHCGSPISHLS